MTYSDLSNKFQSLDKIFDDLYEKTVKQIDLDSVTLKNALKSQVRLQIDWEFFYSKVSTLYNIVQEETEVIFSTVVSKEMKDSYKSTTITEAKIFAKCDKNYIVHKELEIRIKGLLDKTKSVLEIINSRKYILNNITNSVVNGVENHII